MPMMTPEEKETFRIACRQEAEVKADEMFLKLTGRTFRGDADDLARARGLEEVPHAQRNGDSSKESPDSLARIKRDFPGLFSPGDDAA